MYYVAGGIQVYYVAGGIQVYSVTNYSTCCFLLHLQLSKNYIYKPSLESTFHSPYSISPLVKYLATHSYVCGV